MDTLTGKRRSLGASDRDAAEQIVLAKNQALRQPVLNLQIARAYLAGSDSGVATRTWAMALEAFHALFGIGQPSSLQTTLVELAESQTGPSLMIVEGSWLNVWPSSDSGVKLVSAPTATNTTNRISVKVIFISR